MFVCCGAVVWMFVCVCAEGSEAGEEFREQSGESEDVSAYAAGQ